MTIATTGSGVMTGSAFAHESVVFGDVGYATQLRPPSATEQHVHGFLETLPFATLAFTGCLHPERLAALFDRGDRDSWRRTRKQSVNALPARSIISVIGTFVVLPHLEEVVRGYRVDRTFLPHARRSRWRLTLGQPRGDIIDLAPRDAMVARICRRTQSGAASFA